MNGKNVWRWWVVLVGMWATLFSMPGEVQAADTWTTVHPGVRRLLRTTSEPNRIHALEVDLCRAGVSVRATKTNERRQRPSAFGRAVGAQAAINGDFFSYTDYSPTGLAIGEGAHWAGTADNNSKAYVAFGKNRVDFSGLLVTRNQEKWMRSVVSGRSVLVEDGVALQQNSGPGIMAHCSARHPRSMMGLSKDRRTLYLAVVDGRQAGVSRGMLCTEMAALMKGLGAYSAVELDGGGSSAMWVEGVGVVNRPSDGSERVVANHLAIHAKGSALPGSCDRSFEESSLQTAAHNASTTTDIDGDGKADACSLGPDGIECYLAGSSPPFSKRVQGPALPLDRGWSNPANYSTIRYGDINGDGKADICARYNTGVRCFLSTGSGFSAGFDGPTLSNDGGWNATPAYYSTLKMADVNGDGKDDLCARGSAGFYCYMSQGNAFSGRTAALAALNDANGFHEAEYYGTIRMGDINGDGRADVCARTKDGMRCWLSTGNGFGTEVTGPAWRDSANWHRLPYWSTIRLADVDGDGRADLCARSSAGFRCHLSRGTSFGGAVSAEILTDASGWDDHDNFSTIQLADVNGDGKLDVCARANARVTCYPWNGNGWGSGIASLALDDAGDWNQIHYYSTIRFADVNGDGKADLCARGFSRFDCSTNATSTNAANLQGPAWSNGRGWTSPAQYTTIQLVDPPARASEPEPEDPEPEPGDDVGVEPDVGFEPDAGDFEDLDAGENGEDAGDWADASWADAEGIDAWHSEFDGDGHAENPAIPSSTAVMEGSCACTHITAPASRTPAGVLLGLAGLGAVVMLRRKRARGV